MSFLQYADGKNDLDVIKEKLGVSKLELNKIFKILKKNKLIFS